jgi:hypothetical protein
MTEDMLDFLRALHRAGARFLLESPFFDGAFARRLTHRVEGVEVSVVHPEDFKALKRAFGRPVDLRDLEEL